MSERTCPNCKLSEIIKNGQGYIVPGDGLRIRIGGDGIYRGCVNENDSEIYTTLITTEENPVCIFESRFTPKNDPVEILEPAS